MSAEDKIKELEARRAARRDANEKAKAAQRAIDLEALDSAEEAHGFEHVGHLDVPFTPGLPTLVVYRCPNRVELDRYRYRVKPKRNGEMGNAQEAADELCAVVREYPDAETFGRMVEKVPGLRTQVGLLSLSLAAGRAEDDAKS